MIAIIAEKPSLARNIVAGLGTLTKKNGYFENDKYIVTWAFGHLFSLCDVEDYSFPEADKPNNTDISEADELSTERKKQKWTMDNLPCYPKKFRFRLKSDDDGVKKQFAVKGGVKPAVLKPYIRGTKFKIRFDGRADGVVIAAPKLTLEYYE